VKKELIIRSNSNAVDFAMLNEGRLVELDKEVGKNKFSVGDIFVAKIRKTIPGLNAAFVNVGHEKDGFLHYHDLGPKLLSLSKFVDEIDNKKVKSFSFNKFQFEKDIPKNGLIKDCLKAKQTTLVQIIKEPISTKGPRLSSEISLAGRFMVLIPFSERISISQKIKSQDEKKRLKNLVKWFARNRWTPVVPGTALLTLLELALWLRVDQHGLRLPEIAVGGVEVELQMEPMLNR
jgi:ribonuclease G